MSPGDRVIYVPNHADGDRRHPDCEHGAITSIGEFTGYIFVLFDGDLRPKACYPHNIVKE